MALPTLSFSFGFRGFSAEGRGGFGIIVAALVIVIYMLGLPLILSS